MSGAQKESDKPVYQQYRDAADSEYKLASGMLVLGFVALVMALYADSKIFIVYPLMWAIPVPFWLLAAWGYQRGRAKSLVSTNLLLEHERDEIAHKRQLEIIEANKMTKPRWELDYDAAQAVVQREHQRLLLMTRQPHELRMQAMSMPGTLMLIVGQIQQADKIGQFEAMINRTQAAIDRVVKDSQAGVEDTEAATQRAQKASEFLLELIEAWARKQ